MIKCEHPQVSGLCWKKKDTCCRHCDENNNCMSSESLCPYINNEKDLKIECPFEKKGEKK